MKVILLVFFFSLCFVLLFQPAVAQSASSIEKEEVFFVEKEMAKKNKKSAFAKYKSTDGIGDYIDFEEM
jgi:hypothetical protein